MLQVPLWTVDDVACWVRQIGFETDLPAFIEAGVDGDLLLQLDEGNIRDDICIKNGIHRKRFLRELATLKRNANYSSIDSPNLAGFLASKVGAEYRAYTYGLLRNDLCLELMQRLTETDLNDMLDEAGVKMAIHRHRIIEAIAREDAATADDEEVAHFLSSRTSSGSSLASSAAHHHPRLWSRSRTVESLATEGHGRWGDQRGRSYMSELWQRIGQMARPVSHL